MKFTAKENFKKLFPLCSFCIIFAWLPASHALYSNCRQFLNKQPTHAITNVTQAARYKLLWIGNSKVFVDRKKNYRKTGLVKNNEEVFNLFSNEEKWVDCFYDERAYAINGNLTCGERLLSTNRLKTYYVFDKRGVRWRAIYEGVLDLKIKYCQILEDGKKLIDQWYTVSLFNVSSDRNYSKLNVKKNEYFLIKKIISEEISVYYPEF